MYRDKRIAVVVPAYNEERLIVPTLETIPEIIDIIFVVNDGSTDSTEDVVLNMIEKDRRIRLINKENGGAGSAIIAGYKASIETNVDITVTMDGDNQMDPAHMPRLLDPLVDGLADYSKGNRLTSRKSAAQMSKWRFFGNNMLTYMNKVSSGYWGINDPQNGYTAIKNSVFKVINPDEIFTYYGYLNDLLTRLNMNKFRVADVPMPARYGSEKSKIKYPEYIYRVSRLLLLNFVMRISHKQKGKGVVKFISYCLLSGLFSTVGLLVLMDYQPWEYELFSVVFYSLFATLITISILLTFYLLLIIVGTVLLYNERIW